MNFPRRLRETAGYWLTTHIDARLDELAADLHTPERGPNEVATVVVALDTDDMDAARIRALQSQVDARTLDREIIIRGRRDRTGRSADE